MICTTALLAELAEQRAKVAEQAQRIAEWEPLIDEYYKLRAGLDWIPGQQESERNQ